MVFEVVIASNIQPIDFFFGKIVRKKFKKIQWIALILLQLVTNKTLHNFHITNPNGENHFFGRKAYIL